MINPRVPIPTCGEMQAACLANVQEAERLLPMALRKLDEASDAVREWVELDGKIEKDKRTSTKRYWMEQIEKHRSDKRHWLLKGQEWRSFVAAHPEMTSAPVGSRCSHGAVAPMCGVEVAKKRDRQPGDDDDEG